MSYKALDNFKHDKFQAIKGVCYDFESQDNIDYFLAAKWIEKSDKPAQATIPAMFHDAETIWHGSGKKVMK